jgi:hypothetical protein
LPALAEIRDLDTLNEEFGFDVIEDKTIDNESVEQFDSAALEAIPTAEAEVQSSH